MRQSKVAAYRAWSQVKHNRDGGRRKGGKAMWPSNLGAQEHPACRAVPVRMNNWQRFDLE